MRNPGAGRPLLWLNLAIALNVVGVCTAALAAIPGLVDWAFGIPRTSAARKDYHVGVRLAPEQEVAEKVVQHTPLRRHRAA